MATSSVADTPTGIDRDEIAKLLGRIYSFAKNAEALAQRKLGKLRTLAALNLLAALWLGYAFYDRIDWGWAPALVVFAVVAAPALALWKIHGALKPMIGLPQRLVDAAARLRGKAAEYKGLLESRADAAPAAESKPKFAQLREAGQLLAQLKGLSSEAREIAFEASGALVLANPVFAIALGIAIALAMLVVALGVAVGSVYVL
jgi:hypothetical protein